MQDLVQGRRRRERASGTTRNDQHRASDQGGRAQAVEVDDRLRVHRVLGGQAVDRVARLGHDHHAVHRRDHDLVAGCDRVGRVEVGVRPPDLGHRHVVLRRDRGQVLARGDRVCERPVVDRCRRRDGYRLDDRAVATHRDVAVVAAPADHDGLGVHRTQPRRQCCGEMPIYRRVARHRYRYSEDDGMGQVAVNSQLPTPRSL